VELLVPRFGGVAVLESDMKGKTKPVAEGMIGVVPSGEEVVDDEVEAVVLED
jgi:hypothetical protein